MMILFICSYWALARDNHRILFKECENIISKYFRFEKRRHSQQTEFSSVIFLCLLCAMQRLINRIRWFVKSVRTLLFIDRLNFILNERISNIILYVTYEYICTSRPRILYSRQFPLFFSISPFLLTNRMNNNI